MSPDELRVAAKRAHVSEPFYAEACRRLADVIEYVEDMYGGDGMGEYIVDCDAGSVWRIARGDTTNHENRSE